MWSRYTAALRQIGPVDVLIANGDLIDGRGERSGGRELLTADRMAQAEIASDCLKAVKAKRVLMTYGTPYHTGMLEDWEDVIASRVGTEKPHDWLHCDIGGVVFDVRHKVGGSGVPHGRYTATQRERLWNLIWADRGMHPKADILLRSHVHYYGFSGDARGLAMTLPALQAAATIYGGRQCTGSVDFGVVEFNINPKTREYTWHAHLSPVAGAPVTPVKIH